MQSSSLGVQSYCFRGFKDNQQVIQRVKECGLSRIELCGVHVNFAEEKTFDQVIKLYRSQDVAIDSIGVQGLNNNLAAEEKFFDFAKRAGAGFISVSFNPDTVPQSYRTAEKLADKYNVRLAIHNHGGRDWLGCSRILQHVFANTSERIGLCLDTAWALDSGEDPIAMVEKFAKRLYGLHIKDFVFNRARKPEDVIVGSGNLDLKKLSAALNKANFNGYAVLEYEGDVNDPVPALKRCVEAVRKEF